MQIFCHKVSSTSPLSVRSEVRAVLHACHGPGAGADALRHGRVRRGDVLARALALTKNTKTHFNTLKITETPSNTLCSTKRPQIHYTVPKRP